MEALSEPEVARLYGACVGMPLSRSKQTLPALAAVRPAGFAPSPRIELTVRSGGGAERLFVHDKDVVKIGSHESNDIVIPDPEVSRFHCQLVHVPVGDHWRVCDPGSLNGTMVGAIRIRDADLPPAGAELSLGGSVIFACPLAATKGEPLPDVRSFGALHGRSDAMRKMFALIDRVAPSDATVLIEGESGTGKEFVATELVRRSTRATSPFVVVDCGAISPQLVESTLFGHARGAFTGADRDREGTFEAAHGGTIFLDEIGELPLEMQPKLLRVLESRTVCRLGETRRRPVDVRILAATNRQLAREMNHGRFREDLYFRLSVVSIRVPPLRDRLEDLGLLVRAMVDGLRVGDARELFTDVLLARMAEYDWPGNVRELRNFVERTALLRQAADVPARSAGATSSGDSRSEPSSGDLALDVDHQGIVSKIDVALPFRQAKEDLIAMFEKKYIAALLQSTNGNITRAARHAQMDRINLHRLIQRHGLAAGRSIKD